IRRFAANDIHIYSIDALGPEWNGPHSDPNQHDFSETAPRLQRALEADPDALFLFRMSFETRWQDPKWWNALHPNDVEVRSDGTRWGASYGSRAWPEDVSRFLVEYMDVLKAANLYDRVIAYQICCGTCGEWIKSWLSMDPETGDFSPAMRDYFRGWLRERYHTDAALQAAWGRNTVTLETAEVPSSVEQDTTTQGVFRDPNTARNVVDFYECYADA